MKIYIPFTRFRSWSSYAVLALILLISAGLRIYGLDYQSLWIDEFRSLEFALSESLSQVVELNQRNVHPPLFDIILFFIVRTIGDSAMSLRILSAVAGIVATLFIFILGRQLYSTREGLVAASLLAVSWFPVFLSQNGRPYSLLILLTIVSFHLWLRLQQKLWKKDAVGWTTWLPYVLCAIFLIYLHYFGCLVIVIQALYFIPMMWADPKCRNLLVKIYGLIAIAYLPWLPTMLIHLFHVRTWLPEPTPYSLVIFFKALYYPSPLVRTGAVLLYALGLWGMFRWVYLNRNSLTLRNFFGYPSSIVLFWLSTPIIISYAISGFIVPVWQNRNLVIVLPAAYLLLARSISMGIGKNLWQNVVALLMTSIIAYALIFDNGYYSRPKRPQFREAAAYIAERESRYSGAPVVGCVYRTYALNYYFKKLGAESHTETLACKEQDIGKVRELIARENPDYLWFASAHRIPTKSLLKALSETLETVEHKKLHRAAVILYRVRQDP